MSCECAACASIATNAESGDRRRLANSSGPPKWPKEVEMDAITRGWDVSMRRAVALFLGLVAIALLAGAAGGYLTRGATTLVVTSISKTGWSPA